MSEALRFHPADPGYHPDPAQEEAVVDLLHDLFPRATEIERHTHARPRYIDAGSALQSVTCSRCGKELAPAGADEAGGFWFEALARQAQGGAEAEVTLPCCGAAQPFGALRTRPATGFAVFEVQVNDPAAPPLAPARLADVGLALGCECRQVVARFEE